MTEETNTHHSSTAIDPLQGKRVVILGLARQGTAFARFASEQGASVIVSDLRSAEKLAPSLASLAQYPIEYHLGDHPFSLLDGADFLVISGGVSADFPLVQEARARGITLTNDSQEFTRRCPAPMIGLTGSAGKSTTTSLLGAIGRASGRKTWIGGNLGNPLILELPNIRPTDLVVQELSSFQLEHWEISPPIAAILNISPNHLDRHITMENYTDAKARIFLAQSADDVAVLPSTGLEHLYPLIKGRLRHFSATTEVEDGAFVRDGKIIVRNGMQERTVCDIKEIRLRGKHNLLNVLAAVVMADSAELPVSAMQTAINEFQGIPHRLELVANIDGVQYINDSIATAPERALAALNAFHEPIILLAGGRDKKLEWEGWADVVAKRVKRVILFGESAEMIAPLLQRRNIPFDKTSMLQEAIVQARIHATNGDVILLSPGGTSFDAFEDFAERGDQFRTFVNAFATPQEI